MDQAAHREGDRVMATLKFTIVGRYEAEPENYDDGSATTPAQMAEFDQESVDNGEVSIADIIEWAADRDLSVRITVDA